MAGTREGGLKAAAKNKANYGPDFYKQIGKRTKAAWEKNGRKPRGFAARPELVMEAARKGGLRTQEAKRKQKELNK